MLALTPKCVRGQANLDGTWADISERNPRRGRGLETKRGGGGTLDGAVVCGHFPAIV